MPLAMGNEGLGVANMPPSLPKIIGNVVIGRSSRSWKVQSPTGVFYNSATAGGLSETFSSASGSDALGFDASRCSSMYSRNDDGRAYVSRNGVNFIIKY